MSPKKVQAGIGDFFETFSGIGRLLDTVLGVETDPDEVSILEKLLRAPASRASSRVKVGGKPKPPRKPDKRRLAGRPYNPRVDLARFGLPRAASMQAFRVRYRELARKHHPDRPGGSTKRMALVNGSWERLQAWIRAGRP